MRKAEIVVLIILIMAFSYLGMTAGGRGRIIAVVSMIIFAALACGSYLLERMYRKARRPGSSIFAPETMLRAAHTREFVYFTLLSLGTVSMCGIIFSSL